MVKKTDFTDLKKEIEGFFEGEVETSSEVLEKYSHDASLFEVKPKAVLFPKNSEDLKKLVNFVREKKKDFPEISITGRSAGTDMSGGPLSESIVLSFTEHLNHESVDLENLTAEVEPGVFYRDFEKKTLPDHISLPVYPASKSLAALGGMIMNNCGGEKSLKYGQIRNFVNELNMVLSDGNEYVFKKINREELSQKLNLNSFEGEVYRKTYGLLEKNYDLIKKAKPKVSKNSAGYALWDIWDRKYFDLTQLFVGSQGTLGIMSKAKVRLIEDKPYKKLVALFFKDWNSLPEVVNKVLAFKPEDMETFDDTTLKLGLRFMPEVAKKAGSNFLSFALRFLPEVLIGIKMLGLPKLIVLVQFVEDSQAEIDRKVSNLKKSLKESELKIQIRVSPNEKDAEKYWIMRRESFSLLRKHVKGKRTAPFIDDFCIDPQKIPEFLPKMLDILKKHKIEANIAGHAGDGNFHIIPLMDLTKPSERKKIPIVSDKVYDLIIQYGGSITAEHNDGIIRTPYLEKMYGTEVYKLFEEVKNIFDPQNIFNPGKKVGGSMEYLKKHIVRE